VPARRSNCQKQLLRYPSNQSHLEQGADEVDGVINGAHAAQHAACEANLPVVHHLQQAGRGGAQPYLPPAGGETDTRDRYVRGGAVPAPVPVPRRRFKGLLAAGRACRLRLVLAP
jgi:hypothetical protein